MSQIGINLCKPPDLLHLLRLYWYPTSKTRERAKQGTHYIETSTQTESRQSVSNASVCHVDDAIYELEAKVTHVYQILNTVCIQFCAIFNFNCNGSLLEDLFFYVYVSPQDEELT